MTKQTEAYQAKQDAIRDLIDKIQSGLGQHEKAATKNWGHVGDLTHVEALLQDACDFINCDSR